MAHEKTFVVCEDMCLVDINGKIVTTLKEINKGIGLKFWIGTTAEYEGLEEKENNVLYIKTDDTSVEDVLEALSDVQNSLSAVPSLIESSVNTLAEKVNRMPSIVSVHNIELEYAETGLNYEEVGAAFVDPYDLDHYFVVVNSDSDIPLYGYLRTESGRTVLRVGTTYRENSEPRTANVNAVIMKHEIEVN